MADLLLILTTVLPLLHLAASEDQSVSGTTTIVVCDGFSGLLKCPPNSLIVVNSAFYGRASSQYCNVGQSVPNNCNHPRALSFAAAACNNRRACRIWNFHIHDDPCVGIYKYALLTYSCRALQFASACDDNKMLSIQCPAGKYIQIREGFYGRMSDEYCDRGPRTDYTCSLPNAHDIISTTCNNKQSCQVLLYKQQDPCFGTLKYMTAAYDCLDTQVAFACSGKQLQLNCGLKRIRVHSGFYGRNSDEYCSSGPRHTYDCSSGTAGALVAGECDGKFFCNIAWSQFAALGDPCVGTEKMTTAKYTCI